MHYELNSGWYFTVSIDAVPPPAVAGVSASTLENGSIKLLWGSIPDDESPVRGYRIYRSVKQAEAGNLLSEIDGNMFTDAGGLIYGITYYYTVNPVDQGGNECASGNIVVSGLSKSLSTSVTSLSAVSKTGGIVELAWQVVSGISYYRVYRSVNFGEKGIKVSVDGNTVAGSFLQTLGDGLTDGTRYYYTVQGVDNSANEQETGNNQASALSDALSPTVPVVSSGSHPETAPSPDNSPRFTWLEAEDPKVPSDGGTGVKGYRYILSRNAAESYNSTWSFQNGLSVSYDKIADGDWYLFVIAEDYAGNQSALSSKKIVINTTGSINGKIFDADGITPLAGIRLELISGSTVCKTGRTDNTGNYSFACVPFGEYKIKIFKPGFNPFETEIITLSGNINAAIINKAVSTAQNIGKDGIASYPNPCKTAIVTFVYKVEVPGKAVIDIYDAAGEKVTTIEEVQVLTGFRETRWDASTVSTGVYFYSVKLETPGNSVRFPVKKLSLVR